MNKREIKSWMAKVKKQSQRIAKERDALRELVEEANMNLGNCDAAIELMDAAADKLSELL